MDQAYGLQRWVRIIAHRWPTVLGLAVGVLAVTDLRVNAGFVSFISSLIILITLVYVGSAVLRLRWFAWVMLLVGLPIVFFVSASSPVSASVILIIVSLVFLIVGIVNGQLKKEGNFALQSVGLVGFGLIALVTVFVSTVLGAYLVAFALLGHAAWDAFHFVRDTVVARSYAEFCGFLDLVVGGTILLYLVL